MKNSLSPYALVLAALLAAAPTVASANQYNADGTKKMYKKKSNTDEYSRQRGTRDTTETRDTYRSPYDRDYSPSAGNYYRERGYYYRDDGSRNYMVDNMPGTETHWQLFKTRPHKD